MSIEQVGMLKMKWHLAGPKLRTLLDSYIVNQEKLLGLRSLLPFIDTPTYGPESRVIDPNEVAFQHREREATGASPERRTGTPESDKRGEAGDCKADSGGDREVGGAYWPRWVGLLINIKLIQEKED